MNRRAFFAALAGAPFAAAMAPPSYASGGYVPPRPNGVLTHPLGHQPILVHTDMAFRAVDAQRIAEQIRRSLPSYRRLTR